MSGRPKCRVCGVDVRPTRDICPACETGYDAAIANVVWWLAEKAPVFAPPEKLARMIERGDADGAAERKP